MLGQRDVDRKILLKLDDRSLLNACKTDTRYAKLCRDDQFWRIRYTQQFGEHAAQYKKQDVTWRNHYLKTLIDLENFPGLSKLSNMIAWDTKGDWKSSYWIEWTDKIPEIKPFPNAPEEIMNWFWLKRLDKVNIVGFGARQKTITLTNVTPYEVYEETSKQFENPKRYITDFLKFGTNIYSPSYLHLDFE